MVEPYASFVDVMSLIVELDVPSLVPFNCFVDTGWNHKDALVTTTSLPLVVFALGSLAVYGWYFTKKGEEAAEHRDKVHPQRTTNEHTLFNP